MKFNHSLRQLVEFEDSRIERHRILEFAQTPEALTKLKEKYKATPTIIVKQFYDGK